MNQIIKPIFTTILILFLLCGANVFGQDFNQLLEAVDKIEANLKALRTDMDRLLSGMNTESITQSDLVSFINDLEYVKSEISLLKNETNKNKQQLASIDNDGFYYSDDEKTRVNNVNDKLSELNALLEDVLSKESSSGVSNPSVKHGKISLSGFVHEHMISGQDETTSFISKRARLTLKGDINEYARIKIQGEFAKTPKLLDGQVTISPQQNWSFNIGQYKPPFGTDFLISASSTPFVNRSNTSGLGTNRDVGFTISFRNKFNPDYSIKLTAGMFNGAGINTTDLNNNKNLVARIETKVLGMFTLAPNINAGKTNDVDSLKESLLDWGSSLTWQWKQEYVEAEYLHSKHGDTKRYGWYVWGGHSFPVNLGFLKEVQLLARYEQYDPDKSIADNKTNTFTIGTNLYVDKKYTKFQLNYIRNNEEGVSVNDNLFLMNIQVAF